MSGVKGRSGRRIMSVMEKRHRIIDKAWEITGKKLNSDDDDRIAVALPIVIKDMVNKQETKISLPDADMAVLLRYEGALPDNALTKLHKPKEVIEIKELEDKSKEKGECGDGGGYVSPGVPPTTTEI
jgi:hypothetical protein